jgi:hypothetical protein
MQRWLVQLQGEKIDLEEFPTWFPKGEIYAIEESGIYYLTGPEFDAAADADAVLKIARECLDQFSAIISLLWRPFIKPTISQVVHEDAAGARSAYVFAAGIAAGRSKARAVGVDASGTANSSEETEAQILLAAAKQNPHLREALAVWADPLRTWGRFIA